MLVRRLISMALAMALITMPALAEPVTLTGTVTYRERIALPANARLDVRLVDMATRSPVVGATANIPRPGQVPIAFTLNVRSGVSHDRLYGLVAEISAGPVLFRNAEPVPVDIADSAPVAITVQPNAGPAPAPMPHSPSHTALLDTAWAVTSIGGKPVIAARPPTLSIEADLRVGGTSGCNNYFTEASFEDDGLVFGPTAATEMACEPEVMQQEAAFFAALAAIAAFEHDGTSLRLLDAAGVPLIGLVRQE